MLGDRKRSPTRSRCRACRCRSRGRGPGARANVAAGDLVAELLDEGPQGNELAERNESDLVVAAGHRAVGRLGDRVVGVGESVGGGLEPAAHDDCVEIGGESGEPVGGLGGAEEVIAAPFGRGAAIGSGVHDVLGPDDVVDLAVDGRRGDHMPLEHGPGGAHVGPGVLWPTTLDDRHVDGVDRLDAEGAEHAAHDKRDDHADGDHGVASTLNELPDRKAGPGHHDGEAGRAEGASSDPERGRHADHGVGRDRSAAEGVVPADEFDQDKRRSEGERPDGETVGRCRNADDAGAEREDRHRNRPAGG